MMSVKKMIDLYVRYCVSEETWDMLYQMTSHGLISRKNWLKFADTCESWTIEGTSIYNGDGKMVYTIDDSGIWKKVS